MSERFVLFAGRSAIGPFRLPVTLARSPRRTFFPLARLYPEKFDVFIQCTDATSDSFSAFPFALPNLIGGRLVIDSCPAAIGTHQVFTLGARHKPLIPFCVINARRRSVRMGDTTPLDYPISESIPIALFDRE